MIDAEVTVVVPTRRSARTLERCLSSIREQGVRLELIVVDNHSDDDTVEIAQRWADLVLTAGPERSAQRNIGARAGVAPALAFIDADMRLQPEVLGQALAALTDGVGQVVIPERSVGEGAVARVRAFERSFYAEGSQVEAARVIRRDLFLSVGGFDEALTGPEDWDLAMRVGDLASTARIAAEILHDEGRLGFATACGRKAYYAPGLRAFVRKHGRRGSALALGRPWLRQPWRLIWPHPLLGLGLVALKGGETLSVLARLAIPAPVPARSTPPPSPPGSAPPPPPR